MKPQSDFPSRLRLLIKELGTSQKRLSLITGVPEASLSRYVAGTVIPTSTVVIKIAETTGVDIGWLLGFGSDEEIERTN